jgi:hypothetical protein
MNQKDLGNTTTPTFPLTDGGDFSVVVSPDSTILEPQSECSRAGTSLSTPKKSLADDPAYC